jgi:transposase-like protein
MSEVAAATRKDALVPAPHPPEFRRRAVELARERAKPIAEIAKDLRISESCLRNWMAQAEVRQQPRHKITWPVIIPPPSLHDPVARRAVITQSAPEPGTSLWAVMALRPGPEGPGRSSRWPLRPPARRRARPR